ncbi:MAG TPA: LysR substrate-binding domain-containing protein [Vicinamibacterales bacterium]
MEMRHLRYFVAVSEALHFGRAAAQLRIAQPSLSQQIRQLEVELQTTLLQRTKRRVQLTEAGRLFLEEARDILAHTDRAAVIARRASGTAARLRIGFAYWMDVTPLADAVKRLNDHQSGIRVDIRMTSVPLLVAALKEERLDVALVRPPVGEPSLESEDVMTEPFVVALPHAHRLSARKQVSVATLADEPFILFPRDSVPQFHDLALKLCRDAGFVPNVRDEVDSADLVLRLVAAGVGISLVPASVRRGVTHPGVAFRALQPSPRTLHTAIAWRRDNPSTAVKASVEMVREVVGVPRSIPD